MEKQFGRLKVKHYAGYTYRVQNRHKEHYWWCVCACGNPSLVKKQGSQLWRGKVTSCGCVNRELDRSGSRYVRYVRDGKLVARVCKQRSDAGTEKLPWDVSVRRQSRDFTEALGAYLLKRQREQLTAA